ncbi:AAA family ATPase [Microbacterium sp. NPDC089321]|uniref:ATP-binding protein n=1 Tax=Microbacterium sp. NPDC089321 TaxID=3155183 RepID=UPI0034136C69
MPAEALPPAPPERIFIGRDAELAQLIDLARSGLTSGLFIVVRGEVGIGKSALIDAAVAQAPASRTVLRGAADAMDRRRAYGMLLDALAPLLTEQDRRMAAEQNEHVAGERLLSAIDSSTREPTVLVLDDLHWADAASLRLLTRLSRSLAHLPLAIVASLRTQASHEVAPELDHLLGVLDEKDLLRAVELAPLPQPTCDAITERLTGARVDATLRRYVAAAGGNPLFLTEMVRALLRDGAVTVGPHGAVLRRIPADPSPSLAMVIMRHLSHLDLATRELLTTAALLGTRFSVAHLRLVADRPMGELAPLLRQAYAAGFLAEIDDDTLGFRHELIQNVLLHDVPTAVRAQLHRDVALTLDSAGVPAATVAGHVLRAPTLGEDLPWLLDLAQRTAAAAPVTAAELWERVASETDASDPQHVAAVAGLARTALSGGRARAAEKLAASALAHLRGAESGMPLRGIELRSLLLQNRHAETLQQAREYAASPSLPAAERAAHLVFGGWPALLLGDPETALGLADEGIALAAQSGNTAAEITGLTLQGLIVNGRGDLDDAVRLLTRAVDLAEQHPSVAAIEAFPHACLAVALADVERHDEATAMLARSIEICERFGFRTGILTTRTLAAHARSHSGNLADIATELEAHAALLDAMDVRLDPPVRGLRAWVVALQRGPDAARAAAADIDPSQSRKAWRWRGSSWVWLGHSQLARARGDAAATRETMWRGWEDLHGAGLLMDCAEIALDVIELWRGQPGRCDEVVVAMDALAARNPRITHLQAAALAVRGVAESRADALIDAAQLLAATPRRLDHARVAELAALALPARDDRARVLAEGSLHSYAEVGADHEARRAASSFRRAGISVRVAARVRPSSGWEALTRTEERIARHVATGETNLEIAQELFISRRTVETHVSNILTKLGLRSRTELAVHFAHRLDARAARTSADQ